MDLFEYNREKQLNKTAPLAARMRPRTLDEFIGQSHIIGPGRLLRRAIQADQLSSVIFYGPPGTGKTTLARIIANTTNAHFISLNAVLAGVKNIREAISAAEDKLGMFGQRTILFIDEVHRFNKAQQDALLPHVENGTVILIGATTENPYFEVNKALVSRSRIFQLNPLLLDDLKQIAYTALTDEERGYGGQKINLSEEALEHLIKVANGDARGILNALELAVETSPPDSHGIINITTEVAEESIQRRAVLYDKDGDAHFDTISAFIKSMRGSDADAALYWLAKMIYAGEDPRFIFRRMLILASEDVGLADPQALGVVIAASQAYDYVGMPEGRFHLAQACLYLATCPKSNTTLAVFDALNAVAQEKEGEVPDHLKDGNRDGDDMGHGAGYLYPHAYRDHWVAQQYLPTTLQGKVFYQPSNQGYEATIQAKVARQREAQLAAMLEPDEDHPLAMANRRGTRGPKANNRWLQRTLGTVGTQLAAIRDRLFSLAAVQRHELILDLNAGTGLLTWEAIRRVPVGGVWSLASNEQTATALKQQARNLDTLAQPVVLTGALADLADLITAQSEDTVTFEVMIGRNILTRLPNKADVLATLRPHLSDEGRLILAETIPQRTQRLYKLLDLSQLSKLIVEKLKTAEEGIYNNPTDPMVNWNGVDLQAAYQAAEFNNISVIEEKQVSEIRLTQKQIERWFSLAKQGERSAYIDHLSQYLGHAEIETIKKLFEQQLVNKVVRWESWVAFVVGHC